MTTARKGKGKGCTFEIVLNKPGLRLQDVPASTLAEILKALEDLVGPVSLVGMRDDVSTPITRKTKGPPHAKPD